ncbi:MAG: F0F1 ATP synthase subunit gamma [Proteobacteria bacterium]|jgi:F-type H+-transporting ATPase subunit gamma|nr:F0F1 ATP synthase subunit gamma [Pseudomonadota bacterium]
MTRLRELEQHRHSLADIREIMNSMKTLAYMETRKLVRFLDAQHTVVQSIEDVAADLLSFYPETLPEVKETTTVYLLIGTERGFCGDFNHALLKNLESTLQAHSVGKPMLVVVGRKLYNLLVTDARMVAATNGASVVEEVPDLLSQAVSELMTIQDKHDGLTVYCLYHDAEEVIVLKRLLPPFQGFLNRPPHFPHPPVLNQSPPGFLAELTEHYLFAALHEMLYTSLMAENYKRVRHLEGAVKKLDDESYDLSQQCNALRQEEIIEEIEILLLNTGNLDESKHKGK